MLASVLHRILSNWGWNRLLVFFILGLVFSLAGIFLALRTGVGFVALFITAIAILPVVQQRISLSELLVGRVSVDSSQGVVLENIELRGRRWSMGQFFSDFWPLFEVYLVYFLTVFGLFVALGAWLDFSVIARVFDLQFGVFQPGIVVSLNGLLLNNVGVLLLGFLFSFVFEFGTLFVVVRNAIFWGLTLGLFMGSFPGNWIALLVILPHLLLEASSYFVSSIAGGVLSRAVAAERLDSERFYSLATQVFSLLAVSLLLVIVAGWVETIAFNTVLPSVLE